MSRALHPSGEARHADEVGTVLDRTEKVRERKTRPPVSTHRSQAQLAQIENEDLR